MWKANSENGQGWPVCSSLSENSCVPEAPQSHTDWVEGQTDKGQGLGLGPHREGRACLGFRSPKAEGASLCC